MSPLDANDRAFIDAQAWADMQRLVSRLTCQLRDARSDAATWQARAEHLAATGDTLAAENAGLLALTQSLALNLAAAGLRIPATVAESPRAMKPITLILAACLLLAGCQSQTPLQRTIVAGEVYTATLNALADQREAGRIDDRQYRQIEYARVVAARALDEMEAAATTGQPFDFDRALRAFNSALDDLIRAKLAAKEPADGD